MASNVDPKPNVERRRDIRLELAQMGIDDDVVNDVLVKIRARRARIHGATTTGSRPTKGLPSSVPPHLSASPTDRNHNDNARVGVISNIEPIDCEGIMNEEEKHTTKSKEAVKSQKEVGKRTTGTATGSKKAWHFLKFHHKADDQRHAGKQSHDLSTPERPRSDVKELRHNVRRQGIQVGGNDFNPPLVEPYHIEFQSDAAVPGEAMQDTLAKYSMGQQYIERYEMAPHMYSKIEEKQVKIQKEDVGKDDDVNDDNTDASQTQGTDETQQTVIPEHLRAVFSSKTLEEKKQVHDEENHCMFEVDEKGLDEIMQRYFCTKRSSQRNNNNSDDDEKYATVSIDSKSLNDDVNDDVNGGIPKEIVFSDETALVKQYLATRIKNAKETVRNDSKSTAAEDPFRYNRNLSSSSSPSQKQPQEYPEQVLNRQVNSALESLNCCAKTEAPNECLESKPNASLGTVRKLEEIANDGVASQTEMNNNRRQSHRPSRDAPSDEEDSLGPRKCQDEEVVKICHRKVKSQPKKKVKKEVSFQVQADDGFEDMDMETIGVYCRDAVLEGLEKVSSAVGTVTEGVHSDVMNVFSHVGNHCTPEHLRDFSSAVLDGVASSATRLYACHPTNFIGQGADAKGNDAIRQEYDVGSLCSLESYSTMSSSERPLKRRSVFSKLPWPRRRKVKSKGVEQHKEIQLGPSYDIKRASRHHISERRGSLSGTISIPNSPPQPNRATAVRGTSTNETGRRKDDTSIGSACDEHSNFSTYLANSIAKSIFSTDVLISPPPRPTSSPRYMPSHTSGHRDSAHVPRKRKPITVAKFFKRAATGPDPSSSSAPRPIPSRPASSNVFSLAFTTQPYFTTPASCDPVYPGDRYAAMARQSENQSQSIIIPGDDWSEALSLVSGDVMGKVVDAFDNSTASGFLSTDADIEDMWLAKVVLSRLAQSQNISVDDLIEDLCDKLDELEETILLSPSYFFTPLDKQVVAVVEDDDTSLNKKRWFPTSSPKVQLVHPTKRTIGYEV